MNNEIWRDVVADLASIVRVQNGNLHADINELLDRAKAVLATQPPQDERGQGDCGNAECAWRGPITECSYLGSVGPCCPKCREIVEPDAEPAQPVALSTLTDSDIVKQVKNSFDSYDHAEINRRELVQSIRAALAASAPAQQAEESQYRDNNWWLGWNAAIRSMNAAPPRGDLLKKINDAWTNYERMGEVCQFEGLPMIYASTLEEIHDSASATQPQPVAAEGLIGDSLIRSAQALLNLDADGALVPHGIGGHARTIIQAFINREAMK